MSKFSIRLLRNVSLIIIFINLSCTQNPKMNLSESVFFPNPVSVVDNGSSFEIEKNTKIYISENSKKLMEVGNYLSKLIENPIGFKLSVNVLDKKEITNGILLKLNKLDEEYGEEGYILTISEDNIIIEANSSEGVFRGIQTLRQALPEEIEATELQQKSWLVATGKINDYPKYAYRGAMLDVSRHFFSVNDVKEYIRKLAVYKINFLHLHLSDDQGWRIEIKSWPNLTKHGGSTQVGGGDGGFYTQKEYKEIVKYAQDNYITIVPEIDMPGHTNAALASYPELNCNGKSPELYTGTEVGFSTLCVDKELTYKFVNDVVKELVELTPGPYIHIGGDESHVTEKDDYIYFINKIQDIVINNGKQMIGWDEIANASIKNNTIIQYWAKKENAIKGVEKNAKVILSPASKTYLDMKYDSITKLGLNWAGYIEIDSAYVWEPSKLIPGVTKSNILGVESPLWTETITNMDELEFMVFPRIIGHAEIGWSPNSKLNWENYKNRLIKHNSRLEIMEINYYNSKLLQGN